MIGPGVAAECLEAADGLHVNEDHFLVEAVDPATGAPVPDGAHGELVFSTVTREALPLLRYRTGDIASLRRGTCACGRTLVRMSKVTGRRDDMLVRARRQRLPQRGGTRAAGLARARAPTICWWSMSARLRAGCSCVVNTKRLPRVTRMLLVRLVPGRASRRGPGIWSPGCARNSG